MLVLVIQHQPDRSLMHFRGKLVRRPAHDGSTFSGVEPSGKPRAVQTGEIGEIQHFSMLSRSRSPDCPVGEPFGA
jgi:hypothetical protein